MNGHPRPVERKIRLWVAQQERIRRKEESLGRILAQGEASGGRHQRAVNVRQREQWR
jgi:hypothetical protein